MQHPEKQTRVELAKALTVANFVITGSEMSVIALDAMVEDLAHYGLDAVLQALTRCRRECKGRLSLAEIIERVECADGRPGADEAWMTALQAQDESATVVWTDETRAAFEIARPALEINDKTGARMAFRDAYQRLVDDARKSNAPASWSASLGWDAETRRTVLESAVQCGRLPPSQAAGLLPPPPEPHGAARATLQLAAVDGVLIAPEVTDREHARQKLAELRAMLANGKAA